jgi:hypothetical protein
MQTLNSGYRGLSYLIGLNLDRLMFVGAILGALGFAAYLGSF